MTVKRRRRFRFAGRSMLAAGCLGWLAVTVRADRPGPSEYGVRSTVMEPAHGRVYAILSVQMASSDPRSMPPVEEDSLMAEVCSTLEAQGFHPVVKGQDPEILITVHYGRAWLRNPYLTDKGDGTATDGIASVVSYEKFANKDVIGSTNKLMDSMGHGYEAKIQQAAAEKLYVRLTGWKYPPDPKAKARMLWQTTVLVDDPDHWNLNSISGGMLTAGAPYFDRETEEKELQVHPPVPMGHVSVGAPRVIDSAATKPAPTAPSAAGVEHRATVAGKKFDLPPGDAITALQLFSRQSGEEIIYPVEQIRGYRTNEVRGEMSARAALDRLLDGTGLSAVQDEKSEALAVRPAQRR